METNNKIRFFEQDEELTQLCNKIEHRVMAQSEKPIWPCRTGVMLAGACPIYNHRHCRVYGFYVSRRDNQWCQEIEALFQARALEGITFGNYAAVTRKIGEKFGEARSIVGWFEESLEG